MAGIDITELAVSEIVNVFHRMVGGYLTIHDYTRQLGTGRIMHIHSSPPCLKAKRGHEHECVLFDTVTLRERLEQTLVPVLKVCHAGVVEVVFPLYQERELLGCMFWSSESLAMFACKAPRIDVLSHGEVERLGLKDKVLGLMCLAEILKLRARCHRGNDGVMNALNSRRSQIEDFIARNYRDPITIHDLSRFLGLSESRTRHVMNELFGQSFQTVLLQYRLGDACFYLTHTELKLEDIAGRCGFSSSRHLAFHFRRHYGVSPSQFRKCYGMKI